MAHFIPFKFQGESNLLVHFNPLASEAEEVEEVSGVQTGSAGELPEVQTGTSGTPGTSAVGELWPAVSELLEFGVTVAGLLQAAVLTEARCDSTAHSQGW